MTRDCVEKETSGAVKTRTPYNHDRGNRNSEGLTASDIVPSWENCPMPLAANSLGVLPRDTESMALRVFLIDVATESTASTRIPT